MSRALGLFLAFLLVPLASPVASANETEECKAVRVNPERPTDVHVALRCIIARLPVPPLPGKSWLEVGLMLS